MLDQGDGKGGGVGALAFAGLDGFVGNEPGVSPAAEVFAFGVTPASDVGFMDIRHARGAAVERNIAGFRQVKHVFVAVVDVALGIDWLEMPGGNGLAIHGGDGDRFDPVKGVLQNKQGFRSIGEGEDELVREQGIGWCGADVEEKRRVIRHHAFHLRGPCFAPSEEFIARRGVFEGSVVNPEIVRRRCDDQIEEFFLKCREDFQAIAA